ncbi:MAG: hypothetical protein ACI4XP_05545 [Acutalibacteraceae bacterium]
MNLDSFYPTVYEVELAKDIFIQSMQENYKRYLNGDMTENTVLSIAISEVWTSGKKYQANVQSIERS